MERAYEVIYMISGTGRIITETGVTSETCAKLFVATDIAVLTVRILL